MQRQLFQDKVHQIWSWRGINSALVNIYDPSTVLIYTHFVRSSLRAFFCQSIQGRSSRTVGIQVRAVSALRGQVVLSLVVVPVCKGSYTAIDKLVNRAWYAIQQPAGLAPASMMDVPDSYVPAHPQSSKRPQTTNFSAPRGLGWPQPITPKLW